jgi:peroxiredoxin Q/BCP
MAISVGDVAPPLSLEGTDGTAEGTRTYSLADYAGQPVVLVFYPADNTPVCTRQLSTYTHDIDQFAEVGAQVLAISPQTVSSHTEFADKQGGFAFPLLSDVDKQAGEAYGVLGPIGFYRRSVFVVDADGVVRYVHRAMAGLTFRSTTELVDAVRASV